MKTQKETNDYENIRSLWEVIYHIEAFMQEYLRENGKTLWEELIESSIKSHCDGCDGLLLGKVEEYAEKFLAKIKAEQMYEIWEETENGMMTIAQGFDKPQKGDMIPDITIDIIEKTAGNICEEARKRSKMQNKDKKHINKRGFRQF